MIAQKLVQQMFMDIFLYNKSPAKHCWTNVCLPGIWSFFCWACSVDALCVHCWSCGLQLNFMCFLVFVSELMQKMLQQHCSGHLMWLQFSRLRQAVLRTWEGHKILQTQVTFTFSICTTCNGISASFKTIGLCIFETILCIASWKNGIQPHGRQMLCGQSALGLQQISFAGRAEGLWVQAHWEGLHDEE